ncbi:MAG TPA: metallophosphoesterase [Anaerolineales bacterium]|nr:metallophosphoesterase [Anaerolineales bacterium]
MKTLVISDIHANLSALDAVLNDAGEFDAVWCLGDVVGYGPDPNECIERIRNLPQLTCLLGNHDAAMIDRVDIDSFNLEARIAVEWTKSVLTPSSWEFIRALRPMMTVNGQTLVHGSPRYPVWEYLLDTQNVAENFGFFETPYCFVGHTHLPVVYSLDNEHQMPGYLIPEDRQVVQLEQRAIVNPGSVGQPRDRNPLASYALFDTDAHTLEFRRVAYPIEAVQTRMQEVRLPQRHIDRLSVGW